MTIRSIVQRSMFILICLCVQTHGAEKESEEKTRFNFTQKAREVLPDQPTRYTLKQIEQVFHPLLDSQVKEIFDAYFQVLFDEAFPPPFHADAYINGGYRCLLSKVMAANTSTQIDILRKRQLTGIYETMWFHKKSIAAIHNGKYRALAEQIPPDIHPCPNCVKEATLSSHQTS